MNTNKFMYTVQVAMFVVIAVFAMSSAGWATTYYVDATNGNDAKSGISPSAAWQTVNKVNNSTFGPGDSVLFKRGEIFRGYTLRPPSSGSSSNVITFGAYGSGDKPIISGAARATGAWTNEGSNKWSLWWSGGNWNGVISQDPSEVYFVDNRGFKTIDTTYLNHEKDWYYDSANGKLYVYTENAGGPASEWPDIEAATVQDCLYVNGKSYITFESIIFEKSHWWVSRLSSSDHITINNCEFHAPGRGGADQRYFSGLKIFRNNSDVTVNGCTFGRSADNSWSGSTGISYGHTGTSAGDLTIQNCTINWTIKSEEDRINITSAWTSQGSNRYTRSAATGSSEHIPVDVWFANHEGIQVNSSNEVDTEFDWYYETSSNTLWVYCPISSPDSYYGKVEYTDNFNLTSISGGYEAYSDHGIEISNFDSGTCLVKKNTINRARDVGILAFGDNAGDIIISDNTVNYSGHTGIQPGIQRSDIGTIIVSNNLVDNSCHKSGGSMAIHGNGSTTSVVIEYNEVRNTKSVPANMEDGGGIGIDFSENAVVRYNYIHDNWGKGLYVYGYNESNFEVYGNVIHGNDCGILIGAASPYILANVKVYNNTCYNNYNTNSYGPNYNTELWVDNATNVEVLNNIAYANNNNIAIHIGPNVTNETVDYNSGYRDNGGDLYNIDNSNKTWSQWRAAGYDINGINLDPQLNNPLGKDFTLKATSPCIDAGIDVGLPYSGSAPDIGAKEYELNPGPPAAPTGLSIIN